MQVWLVSHKFLLANLLIENLLIENLWILIYIDSQGWNQAVKARVCAVGQQVQRISDQSFRR